MVKQEDEYWLYEVGGYTFRKLATPEAEIVMVKFGQATAYENAFAVRNATDESFQSACEIHAERYSHCNPPIHRSSAKATEPVWVETETTALEEPMMPEPMTVPVEGSDLVQTLLDI